MKTFLHLLKVAAFCYAFAFAAHATNRFLAQRDEMVKIEQMNTVIKATELEGSVHCNPS
jgi:hypothetical protein